MITIHLNKNTQLDFDWPLLVLVKTKNDIIHKCLDLRSLKITTMNFGRPDDWRIVDGELRAVAIVKGDS